MKKLITLFIALSITMPAAATAAIKNQTVTAPSLAILDTALDTSLPIFKDKIAYEVCILEFNVCPNGTGFQEGVGAASMPLASISKNGFDHGTMMTSVAVKENPNMKIVFIRIIPHNPNVTSGGGWVRKPVSNYMVGKALEWVYANKDKFNIQAVSMSQGMNPIDLKGRDACGLNKDIRTEMAVSSLFDANIPSFFAVGNRRDYTRIDWPSCIPQAMAIGATDTIGEIASYSNYQKNLLDFYAPGFGTLTMPGGTTSYQVGTSISAQVAASKYIVIKSAKPNLTMKQIYDLIISTSSVAKSGLVPYGKSINLTGVLNG